MQFSEEKLCKITAASAKALILREKTGLGIVGIEEEIGLGFRRIRRQLEKSKIVPRGTIQSTPPDQTLGLPPPTYLTFLVR